MEWEKSPHHNPSKRGHVSQSSHKLSAIVVWQQFNYINAIKAHIQLLLTSQNRIPT